MKSNQVILIVSSVALLAGCASMTYIYTNPVEDETGDNVYSSIPELNKQMTSEIGDNMYEEYYAADVVKHNIELLDEASAVLRSKEKMYHPSGSKDFELRKLQGQFFACYAGTLEEINTYNGCLIDSNNDGEFERVAYSSVFPAAQMWAESYPLNSKVRYKKNITVTKLFGEDSFKKEIIYQGIAKGVIYVSYREFKDDIARPAYTQRAQYDANTDGSGVIAFKGLRINVTKADPSSIKYTVVKPFSGSLVGR